MDPRRFTFGALVAALLMLTPTTAMAGSLRGRIDSQAPSGFFPRPNAAVSLLGWNGAQWIPLSVAYTGPDGLYYFYDVSPGNYALQVNGGVSVPLVVFPQPFQDVSPILTP